MADSSRVQISYLKQTEKGSIPNSAFTAIRHTGGSFGAPQETVRSDEVRGDAQRGAAVRTGRNPEATINMELSAKTFDDLIEGLMRSDWSTAAAVADASITAENAGSKFVSGGEAGDVVWTDEDITKGQWVYVSGFADSATNGWYKVTAISATDLTVNPAPPEDTNTEENEIKVEGSYIRNGTDKPYFALQLEHLDLTDKLRLIQDARIGQLSLSVDARARVTGSFNFAGTSFELKTSKSGDGEVNDAEDTEILNTTDHAKSIFINGDEYEGCVASFNLNANMNTRRLNGVGQLDSCDIGLGSLDASGSLSVYLSNANWDDLLQKYIDFTKISIAFPFSDSDGNGYVFEMPQIALTNEPGNVPGPDADVMLDLDFQAEPGDIGDESKTIQISRRQVV